MEPLLLFAAITLGALAFFEPCSIATHTLFAARAHQKSLPIRMVDIILILGSRSIMLIIIFSAATLLTSAPEVDAMTASIVFTVMASVYLISRKVHIPVPHLEFFRMIAFSSRLHDSIRLGLTAPVCTLPLLVILIVLVVSVNSLPMAVISALLFATLFSVPVFVAATTDINEPGKNFLSKAANGTPYLTAVLLFGAAFYLILPEFNLDRNSLEATLQQAGFAGIGIAFVAGFVFSFNPVSFASIPVVLAYVTRAHEKQQALSLGFAFIFGLVLTHVVLGIAAAMGCVIVSHSFFRGYLSVLHN